jgi:hypothetical protein
LDERLRDARRNGMRRPPPRAVCWHDDVWGYVHERADGRRDDPFDEWSAKVEPPDYGVHTLDIRQLAGVAEGIHYAGMAAAGQNHKCLQTWLPAVLTLSGADIVAWCGGTAHATLAEHLPANRVRLLVGDVEGPLSVYGRERLLLGLYHPVAHEADDDLLQCGVTKRVLA